MKRVNVDKTNPIVEQLAKPYPSWTLNESNLWQAPVAYPTDEKFYIWDEDTISWVEIKE